MYKLTSSPSIILRIADNAFIPADPLNRDYAEYLAWIAAENTPDPYVAPPPSVPAVVSRFQAKAALQQAELLFAVETYMAAPTTPALTKLAWANAQEFQRSSGLLVDAASALGFTNAQLDELFVAASKIVF